MAIEVERVSDDRLAREVWRFQTFGVNFGDTVELALKYYSKDARDTTRHKWRSKPQTRYDSTDPRSYHSGIKAADVPLPREVITEAIGKLTIIVLNAERKAVT